MLESLRSFYHSGKTRSENFRRNSLKKLRQEIFKREDEIFNKGYSSGKNNIIHKIKRKLNFVPEELSEELIKLFDLEYVE